MPTARTRQSHFQTNRNTKPNHSYDRFDDQPFGQQDDGAGLADCLDGIHSLDMNIL